jgi:hypothetical protein
MTEKNGKECVIERMTGRAKNCNKRMIEARKKGGRRKEQKDKNG